VKRNVVALSPEPQGQPGRKSKALTLAQAHGILRAAQDSRMHGYIVLSLLTGDPAASPPLPPHVAMWRSVRAGGDTKTRKSRRTLALPRLCVAPIMTNDLNTALISLLLICQG